MFGNLESTDTIKMLSGFKDNESLFFLKKKKTNPQVKIGVFS